MEKFDPVKMIELVKVEEGDTELVLVFQENRSIRITVVDGGLVSEVVQG